MVIPQSSQRITGWFLEVSLFANHGQNSSHVGWGLQVFEFRLASLVNIYCFLVIFLSGFWWWRILEGIHILNWSIQSEGSDCTATSPGQVYSQAPPVHWARRWPQCYRSQCLVRAARDGDKDAQAAECIVKRIGIPWHALVFLLSFFWWSITHICERCVFVTTFFLQTWEISNFFSQNVVQHPKEAQQSSPSCIHSQPLQLFNDYITASWESHDCAHQHCHLVVPSVVIHCYILESHVYLQHYPKMSKLFAADFGSNLAWTKDMSCKVATQHGHRTSWVIFPVMKNHDRLNYPGPMNPTILLMPTCTTTANDVWCQSLQPIGFHKVKGVEPKVQTGPNPIFHMLPTQG